MGPMSSDTCGPSSGINLSKSKANIWTKVPFATPFLHKVLDTSFFMSHCAVVEAAARQPCSSATSGVAAGSNAAACPPTAAAGGNPPLQAMGKGGKWGSLC